MRLRKTALSWIVVALMTGGASYQRKSHPVNALAIDATHVYSVDLRATSGGGPWTVLSAAR
jgi:hypothetical protein